MKSESLESYERDYLVRYVKQDGTIERWFLVDNNWKLESIINPVQSGDSVIVKEFDRVGRCPFCFGNDRRIYYFGFLEWGHLMYRVDGRIYWFDSAACSLRCAFGKHEKDIAVDAKAEILGLKHD